MSKSGRWAFEGFRYQLLIALRWLITMIHQDYDEPIESISVDSVGLRDGDPTPDVDDIVIRFESGKTLYVQAKKNHPDRETWSLTDRTLKKELRNARNQLESDEDGCVGFYSRDPFGMVGRLADCHSQYPNYDKFESEAPDKLSSSLSELAEILDRTEKQCFDLIGRVSVSSTKDFEGIKRDLIRSLRSVVPSPEEALSVLEELLNKHITGQADTPHHEIEREHVVQALEDAEMRVTLDPGGDRPSRIITHDEKISNLQEKSGENDTDAYLHGSELDFVWPEEGAEYHPERILERLSADHIHGVFLIGPGGIGKSRILLETAKRAHEKPETWEVLHARSTNSLSNKDLYSYVYNRDFSSRIILVVDEITKTGLNHLDIKKNIIEDLTQELVILASGRPADRREMGRRDLELFDGGVIEMHPRDVSDEVSSRISTRIREEVAPTAIRDLKDDEVAELCGNRPAIALHIARKLEQLSKEKHRDGEGGLSPEDVENIRPGELTSWLERRFNEDDLELDSEGSPLGRPKVGIKLLTAATVFAAAPADREQLINVAASVLSGRADDPVDGGRYIVDDILTKRGWLVHNDTSWIARSSDSVRLGTPHDVVEETLLETILVDYTGSIDAYVEEIFSHCSENVILWSNMTESISQIIDRIDRDHDRHKDTVDQISGKADEWFADNARRLAQTSFPSPKAIQRSEKYMTSNALSTAFDAGLWPDEVLVRELALPWLQRYSSNYPHSNFLLVKALNTGHEGEIVRDLALDWYDNYDYASGASYVFRTVASQLDGGCDQSKRSSSLGVRWLNKYGKTSWEGQYIITALLEWETKYNVKELVRCSIEWIDKFVEYSRAHYVISALMNQPELKEIELSEHEDVVTKLESYAIEYLEENGSSIWGAHVINNLLYNDDITDDAKKKASKVAESWLSDHVPDQEPSNSSEYDYPNEARYVLQPALLSLENNEVGTDFFKKASPVSKALLWLEQNLDADGTEYVLAPLLRVAGPDAEGSLQDALEYSFQWLADYGDEERAQRVYTAILRNEDLGDDVKSEIVEPALRWLREHSSSEDRDFVINSLLDTWRIVPTGEERDNVVDEAFDVINEVIEDEERAAFSMKEAKEVLLRIIYTEPDRLDGAKGLLSEPGCDAQREVYHTYFEVWSTAISDNLEQTEAGSEERAHLLEKATDLLCDARTYRYNCEGWHILLEDILNCEDLDSPDRERLITALRDEVCNRQNSRAKRWSFGYQILFKNTPSPTEDSQLMETGFNWIESDDNFQYKAWKHFYEFMLDHCAIVPKFRERLIEIGETWLSEDKTEQREHWDDVYAPILNIEDIDDSDKKEILELGIEIVDKYRYHNKWEEIYNITEREIKSLRSEEDRYEDMLNRAALRTR